MVVRAPMIKVVYDKNNDFLVEGGKRLFRMTII